MNFEEIGKLLTIIQYNHVVLRLDHSPNGKQIL